MTVNKAQGQTIEYVEADLSRPCFHMGNFMSYVPE